MGIAVLTGLLLAVAVTQVVVWSSEGNQPDSSQFAEAAPPSEANEPGAPSAANWPEVVAGLDAARARALAQADPALLEDVYVPGAQAAKADAATIKQLADNGWRVPNARHQISSVATAGPDGVDPIRLFVVDELPPSPIVNLAGLQVGLTATRAQERRVLTLQRTSNGYRIADIERG